MFMAAACTVRDLVTRRLAGDVPSLMVTLVTTILVTFLGAVLALGNLGARSLQIPLAYWRWPRFSSLSAITSR